MAPNNKIKAHKKMMRLLLPWERIKEFYWNNRYKKNNIHYACKGGGVIDVRSVLYLDTQGYWTLSKVARRLRRFTPNTFDEEATMNAICNHVNKRIKYVHDIDNYGKAEYWSDALTTYVTKKGDCDDCSILIKVLSLLAGIPDYKVKCAWVSVHRQDGTYDGEHLNNLFLNKYGWEFKEGTYYPNHYWNDKYGRLNFTFNRAHTWAQNDIKINSDDLKQLTEVTK